MMNLNKINSIYESEAVIETLNPLEYDKLISLIPAQMKTLGAVLDNGTSHEATQSRNLQLQTLHNIVKSKYGKTLRQSEISYAFELFLTGCVEVEKEHHHYGQFSIKFICEMLNDYIAKRNDILKHQPKKPIAEEFQLPPKHPFDECMENYIFILEQTAKDGVVPMYGNFDYCFYFLQVIGVIKFTETDYAEHVSYVRLKITEECDKLQSPEKRKEYRNNFNRFPEMFKTKCRDEYFKRWLQERLTDFILQDGSLDMFGFNEWVKKEVDALNEKSRSGGFDRFRKRDLQGK